MYIRPSLPLTSLSYRESSSVPSKTSEARGLEQMTEVSKIRCLLQRYAMRSLSRRMAYIFLVILVMWTVMTVNILVFMPVGIDRRPSQLVQKDIVRLSEEYIQALALENGHLVDGQYVSDITGYDMKKTLAVLLDNMLSRLRHLEQAIRKNYTKIVANESLLSKPTNSHKNALYLPDVLAGKTENCELTEKDKKDYPYCLSKIQWMKKMWRSDKCYASYGVDGTMCSFLRYLSEVENWCPSHAWMRRNVKPMFPTKIATIRTDNDGLLSLLVDPNERHAYMFMRMRVSRMWPTWVAAIRSLEVKQPMASREHKRVLIHMGLLTKEIGWKFAENQFSGGPLGELVQWTDLIACLYILGHDIILTSEVEQIRKLLHDLPAARTPCQNLKSLPMDLFYTDIGGLRQIKKYLSVGYSKFKCLLRIVDSFGTEPAFNHPVYAKKHNMFSLWGGHLLNPRQFFTMFPHTPDNSFMGFVVEHKPIPANGSSPKRKNQALIYGKRDAFWKGKEQFLEFVNRFLEIHATVGQEGSSPFANIPPFVHNHGILSGDQLSHLLRQSKLFVGLGFPYEGPAPLEAIANGAVFINPKFTTRHNRWNVKFMKEKPTSRNISSQHPYAESFIGEPHVYTIDINNLDVVNNAISHILETSQFTPYLPYEFTEEGMLQRMSAYIQHQDFCPSQRNSQKPRWPPRSKIHTLLSPANTDCSTFCSSRGFRCEPSYFPDLNDASTFANLSIKCKHVNNMADIVIPGVEITNVTCLLQSDQWLFSCAGRNDTVRRICPCRTFAKGQVAL